MLTTKDFSEATRRLNEINAQLTRSMGGQLQVLSTSYQDQMVKCLYCGGQFLWSVPDQAYFQEKGLSAPARCNRCRRVEKMRITQERVARNGM